MDRKASFVFKGLAAITGGESCTSIEDTRTHIYDKGLPKILFPLYNFV